MRLHIFRSHPLISTPDESEFRLAEATASAAAAARKGKIRERTRIDQRKVINQIPLISIIVVTL